MAATLVYKICHADDWAACERDGRLPWSEVDRRDGFVHLSAAHQVHETAAKHFAGRSGLVLLTVACDRLPEGALRWEVSRGGDRFPHLHGDLLRQAVVVAEPAPLGPDDVPVLPLERRSSPSGPEFEQT